MIENAVEKQGEAVRETLVRPIEGDQRMPAVPASRAVIWPPSVVPPVSGAHAVFTVFSLILRLAAVLAPSIRSGQIACAEQRYERHETTHDAAMEKTTASASAVNRYFDTP